MSTNLNNPIWILEDDRYQIKDFEIVEKVNDVETCTFTVYPNKNLTGNDVLIRERQEIAVEFESGKYKHFYVDKIVINLDYTTYYCVDWYTIYRKYYFGKLLYNENNNFEVNTWSNTTGVQEFLYSGLNGYNPKNKLHYIDLKTSKDNLKKLSLDGSIADYETSKHNVGKESFGEVMDKILDLVVDREQREYFQYVNTTSTKRDEFELRVEYAYPLIFLPSKHLFKYDENILNIDVERDISEIINKVYCLVATKDIADKKTMEVITDEETGEKEVVEYGHITRFEPTRVKEHVVQDTKSIELYGTRVGKTVINYNTTDTKDEITKAREQLNPFRNDVYNVSIPDNRFTEQLRLMNVVTLEYPAVLFNEYGTQLKSKKLFIIGRTLKYLKGKFYVTDVQLCDNVVGGRDKTELRKNIDELNKQVEEIKQDYQQELRKLYENIQLSVVNKEKHGSYNRTYENGANFWSVSLSPRISKYKGVQGTGITVNHDEILFQTFIFKEEAEKDVWTERNFIKANSEGKLDLTDDVIALAPLKITGKGLEAVNIDVSSLTVSRAEINHTIGNFMHCANAQIPKLDTKRFLVTQFDDGSTDFTPGKHTQIIRNQLRTPEIIIDSEYGHNPQITLKEGEIETNMLTLHVDEKLEGYFIWNNIRYGNKNRLGLFLYTKHNELGTKINENYHKVTKRIDGVNNYAKSLEDRIKALERKIESI